MATFGSEDTKNGMGYSAGSILGAGYALSEEGTVSKVTLRVRAQAGTANVQCAIYSGNTRKGYSGSVNCDTTAAWKDFELTTPVTLSAGTYRLCFNCEAAVYVYYADAGATGYEDGGVAFGTWPETADLNAAGTLPLAIYATYEIPPPPGLVVYEAFISGPQLCPIWHSPSLILMTGWDATLLKITGTDRAIAWSIRQLGSSITEAYAESQTVTTTEHSLPNDATYSSVDAKTDVGTFQIMLDVNALGAGDLFRVRIYEAIT